MMPIEVYITVLVACSCIIVVTVSSLVAGVYFKARVSSMETKVARLDGDVTGLIHESHGFARKMQQVAVRATGAMEDVEQITHTAREWTDHADRMVGVVATVTKPPIGHVSKYVKFGGGFLSGVLQALLTPGKKSWFNRSIDMSENCNGSATPRIMTAFATGALVGAGVAILFAPRSGKQTRDMLVDKTHDLKDAADDVIERGKHLVNEVKHEAREAFKKGKEAALETSKA